MGDKKKKLIVLSAAVLICVTAAVVSVFFFRNRSEDKEDFSMLQSSVNRAEEDASSQAEESADSKEEESSAVSAEPGQNTETEEVQQEESQSEPDALEQRNLTIPEKNLDWAALKAKNKDIYAWIYIPGTKVDYPVLQHPTSNSYYLDYNLDGTKGYPGCIYTENYNSKDFTDPHTVLYGHNMKNGTMFGTLHNYEDQDTFFGEDHYIFIYTEENVYVYLIFAAYDFDAIHLLANYDLSNEKVYEQYINNIFKVKNTSKRVANIRDDVEVTKDDRIITLSTCTKGGNENYRFLVVGVLLNPQQLDLHAEE